MNNLSEEIIAKFLMGKCTEEELVQVNLWIKESDENARKLFRMEEIYHLGKEKHTVSPKRMDQAERSLYKRLAIEEAKQNRTLAIHRWMKYAAIITVILLTGTGITYWIGQNALINNKMIAVASEGNVEEIVLPDGTKVWLNQSAVLKYPREFSDKERNVYLEGEAYFEVSHDTRKPFIVHTGELTVTVLGTEFNVNTRIPTHVRTTLVEGKVQVTFKEGIPYILTPGEMASTDVFSGQTTVEQVNIQKYIAWRHGRFCFEEATIEEIMQELSLWYDLQVEYQNQKVKQEKFSGYLPRGESVMSILQKIEQTSYVHFKRVQNKIIVGY